ncbi:dTDP-4-dehydrorhamnose reductase [Kangiella sp.]|uniref:dTDP-4-dehydrorhamnose reductase n=1 Tax=Gammaproteobacteria TaxID=1236 RepID=UPI003A8DD99C
MVKRVLVTGKNGQLGQSLQKAVIQNSALTIQHSFSFVGRDELDLACSESISAFFSNQHFDAIINCAAYTAVDKAESEPELANQINHLAVAQLAGIAKLQRIPLIHISTDYVFNVQGGKPYVETDATDPQNVYGLTKLNGEKAMQASGCAGAIIRTSWVYSEFGNNFVKTMLRLGKERDSLNVIFDQIGSPTYAGDLAETILQIIDHIVIARSDSDVAIYESGGGFKMDRYATRSETSTLVLAMTEGEELTKNEIYHYSNEGICSWYDFAKAIFELSGISCQVNPIETREYPTPAKRPHYSVMNKTKIKQLPDLVIPYWRDSLCACLKELEVSK